MKAESVGAGRRLGLCLATVSALGFGLSLRGTPPGYGVTAGDSPPVGGGDRPRITEVRGSEQIADNAGLTPIAPTDRALFIAGIARNTDFRLRRARIISSVPSSAASDRRVREAIACDEPGASAVAGDACRCDAECCGLSSEDGCVGGHCVNNQCVELNARLDSGCEAEGDWCTLEQCDGDGNCVPLDDGGGGCQPDGTNCLSRCPRQCEGGSENGKWCERSSDCPGGRCLLKPTVSCNNIAQRCQVDAKCDGGINEGDPCATDGDCSGGSCDGGSGRCCEYEARAARDNPLDLTATAQPGDEVYDLVYVIDGSGSIAPSIFELQKEGVKRTICGPSAIVPPDGTVAVAVIQFSDQSAIEIPLTVIDSTATAEIVCANINIIGQLTGTTQLAPALSAAYDMLQTEAGGLSRHLFISTDSRARSCFGMTLQSPLTLRGFPPISTRNRSVIPAT